jgi:hypothetical protein
MWRARVACGLPPIVGDNHRSPFDQGGRDSDDRTRALLHNHGEGFIRLILGFKVKKGVLPEHDEVIVLGLQENMRRVESVKILSILLQGLALSFDLRNSTSSGSIAR